MTINKYATEGSPAEAINGREVTVAYPQISTPLLLLFCGYVICWYLEIGIRIHALGAIRFEFIYAAFLTGLAIFLTPKIDTSCQVIKYVIAYLVLVTIQMLVSYDFETSWNIYIDRIIKFAFMTFFIVSFVRSPKHLKFFLGAFLLACLKLGQEGLIGHLSGSLIWENQGVMRLHGSTPWYDHPNSFSGMALGTLPFVYYLWPLCNKYAKLFLALVAVLSVHIIIYAGSRTTYIGLFVFIAYLLLQSKAKKKFILWLIIIALMTAPFIPSEYIGRFDSIFTGQDKVGHSTDERMQILKDALQIFIDDPLGVGVGAFPKKRMDTFGRFQDTHNLYLEIATNLGIQGIIIVGLFIYKMIVTLQGIRSASSDLIRDINSRNIQQPPLLLADLRVIAAVAQATIAFIVIRLALGLFGMDLYEIYWWFALGICISLFSMLKKIQHTLHPMNISTATQVL